jgi:hypothetical protein
MTQKISLLDAVPHSVGDIEEAAMLHVYNQSWQLYTSACNLRPVSSQSEIRRLDYVSLRNPAKEAERKSDLWQMLQYSAEFHHLIETKTEQLIPLPYWNLIFWKNFPVFNYTIDGRDYAYMTATENLMVAKTFVALAHPISEETVLKIQTEWPFENLQKAFGEMVRQGWLNSGAELLVPKRFVRFGKTEPVPPTTAYFEWKSSQSRLRCVADVLDLRKSILHQHFLHKGKPLNEKALQRGLKVTEYDYFDVIADILQPYLPN